LSVTSYMTPKKKAQTLLTLTLLITTTTAGFLLVDSAAADPIARFPDVPTITVNQDGSVTPPTELIRRSGNIYILTGDINETQLIIERSNIVLDGNGHALSLMSGVSNPGVFIYYYPLGVTNVVIKNLTVFTPLYTAISLTNCTNCQITGVTSGSYVAIAGDNNTVTQSIVAVYVKYESENNCIFRNNITDLALFSGSNFIYENNILLDINHPPYLGNYHNFWQNGLLGMVGNYWAVYSTIYPNASEREHTGVADDPYVLDAQNTDFHPLMLPVNIETGYISSPSTPFPAPESSGEPLFPTAYTAAILAVAVCAVVVCVGLAVYSRKRRV